MALRVHDGGVAQSHHAREHSVEPTPEFWRATRLVLRRVRIGFYGMGSAVFAAMLGGTFLLGTGQWVVAAGLLGATAACLIAVIVELLESNLGKGGVE